MENFLIKIIYLIIHTLIDWLEAFYYFGLEFRDNFYDFINKIIREDKSKSFEDEIVIIERKVQELKKIPKHIAVLLNLQDETDVDLSRLSDLIFWALNSGINFISFYDHKGKFKGYR